MNLDRFLTFILIIITPLVFSKWKLLINVMNNKKKILETGVPVYDSWSEIYSFFKRCLVPSTEESRKLGAGAGLVDTD